MIELSFAIIQKWKKLKQNCSTKQPLVIWSQCIDDNQKDIVNKTSATSKCNKVLHFILHILHDCLDTKRDIPIYQKEYLFRLMSPYMYMCQKTKNDHSTIICDDNTLFVHSINIFTKRTHISKFWCYLTQVFETATHHWV